MNFSKMKIKKSLILGFGIAIGISAILIVIALVTMSSLGKGYEEVISTEIEANQLITSARLSANIAARNVRDMALIPDDPANPELEAQAKQMIEDVNSYLSQLAKVWPLDQSSLNSYTTAVNNWTAEIPDILTAIDNMETERATSLIYNNCTPKLNTMTEIASQLDTELTARQESAVQSQQRTVLIAIVALIAALVITTVLLLTIALRIIRAITAPLEEARRAMVAMSQGNLHEQVDFTSANELGEMCDALRTSQQVLSSVVQDISSSTGQMAKGNFDVELTATFPGDLKPIQDSINQFVVRMSETVSNISQSADQVSAGADQVSNSSQSLAQGATEQASAVEELAATINDISTNSKQTATAAEEAQASVSEAGNQISASNEYVKQLNVAMTNISNSSEEIGKIIATIENIAFQTNILALNAAVEAARAGTAGKGFAVVAEEVRNLATKSDEAAKATKDLIDNSIRAVHEGAEVVEKVTDSLAETTELASSVVTMMGTVTEAVENQTTAIAQITEGIDQISAVVQTNSATSEECAAASEQLSSQANIMHQLMSEFRISRRMGFGASTSASSFSPSPASDSWSSEEEPPLALGSGSRSGNDNPFTGAKY